MAPPSSWEMVVRIPAHTGISLIPNQIIRPSTVASILQDLNRLHITFHVWLLQLERLIWRPSECQACFSTSKLWLSSRRFMTDTIVTHTVTFINQLCIHWDSSYSGPGSQEQFQPSPMLFMWSLWELLQVFLHRESGKYKWEELWFQLHN